MAGDLAIVLHTHMPYVEGGGEWPPPGGPDEWAGHDGYGTWPFGEEWLWEAVATSYLPLLDVLARAPITVSLTPVLCDQLAAPGAGDRFLTFLRELRSVTHARDAAELRAAGADAEARAIERAAGDYARAADRFEALGGDLCAALAPHVAWTSTATHAVLPLLATDAGLRLQIETGIAAHRARFGAWAGGFWLPECAYDPALAPLLADAGVHAVCVDLTDVFGPGAPEHLQPQRPPGGGPLLVPLDRETIELVWSPAGYPSHPLYRDYHAHTTFRHHAWANDGSPYDHDAARELAREHAVHFVDHVADRVAGGGLAVCALDTELLGHWWYEGVTWLEAVVDQAAAVGLNIAHLDEVLAGHPAADAPADLPVTTWGTPRDLSTWTGPQVADLAWMLREAELRVLAHGAVDPVAARELLALQSSDWAFLATRELAGEYPRQRAAAHRAALAATLAGRPGPGPRALAPDADPRVLAAP